MNQITHIVSNLKNAVNQRVPFFCRTLGFFEKNKKNTYIEKPFYAFRVLDILQEEGYISHYTLNQEKRFFVVTVFLKNTGQGNPALKSIELRSTSGRNLRVSTNALWQPLNTKGIYILNTSRGLLTDRQARQFSVGGELLISVF